MTPRTGLVSAAVLAGLGLVVALGHTFAPNWARTVGLDVWNLPAEHNEYREVTERRHELSAQHDRLRWQIAASEQVIILLVDGHLTLAAAVDQLEQVNQNRPGFADGLMYLHQDVPTHRLRLARYALAKAEVRLSANPVRQADVAARLTSEYQAMTGSAPAESPPPNAVAMGTEDD